MALLQVMLEALTGAQTELVIFIFAICAHAVLFGGYRIRPMVAPKRKKVIEGRGPEGAGRPSQPPNSAPLVRIARQLLQADIQKLTSELQAQLLSMAPEDTCNALAGMLQHFGKTASAELLAAVRAVLKGRQLLPTAHLGALLLRGYAGLGLCAEFQELRAELEVAGACPPAAALLGLKAALVAGDLAAALKRLRGLAPLLGPGGGSTASAAPQQLLQQLMQLASKHGQLPELLQEFKKCTLLTSTTVEALLAECVQQGEPAVLCEVRKLARAKGIELTDRAYAMLVRAAVDAEEAERLFAEAARRKAVGNQALMAAVDSAFAHGSEALATAALQHPCNPSPELGAALLHLVAKGPRPVEDRDCAVLDVYSERLVGVDILVDLDAGRLVAEAALCKGRSEVLRQLLAAAAADTPRQVALLKSFGSERRLQEATRVFEACPEKTTSLYNALLDACIECQHMGAAEKILQEATSTKMADVVTYNTIIKKHIQRGDLHLARGAISSMRAAGGSLAPNCVTFNELIDATISVDSRAAWGIVNEMEAFGVQPNSVTCSILMKSIQRGTKPAEVERTLKFVDSLSDLTDEVLLSSICEACIRAGCFDLLKEQLERQSKNKGLELNSAHTFGSVIRAYGFVQDIQGAWSMWNQMRTRNIIPTSITIGCMVEALVQNGDPDAGHVLIRGLLAEPRMRPLVNAIIYCSVLKGYCHQKRFERVWVAYEEMRTEKLQFSIVTYNALIDACARGCEMSRVQPLLEEMSRQGIEPNIVTYSTVLKGYCQEGRLTMAFKLLKDMKKTADFRPDEITYNTLIDGCARRGLYDQGMSVLAEMQEAGVVPSAFTLSVLVKLAARSGKPEEASKVCENLARKYHIRLNVYVYNNLLNASTSCKSMERAFELLERMLHEGVRPDARTYTLMLRGCISVGAAEDAAGLLRGAAGLLGAPPRLAAAAACGGAPLQPRGELAVEVVSEVLEGIAGSCGRELLAVRLLHELRRAPGAAVRVDPRLSRAWAARVGASAF
eukprot:CAMPEP_0179048432 /NCGR_PEP_ID=MMETSP0796-20121207/19706_1 /TAXON_ID=73915 /ORGANISM="Pyrodinium bahamense, Strain pbaha01" /LENGTH=1014 /DNA_ID=CAMNT_0020744901 /DNA_START=91 /DNA_END=3135 /DNA_ORIENTATION=+